MELYVNDRLYNCYHEDGWSMEECVEWAKSKGVVMNKSAVERLVNEKGKREPKAYKPHGLTADEYEQVRN